MNAEQGAGADRGRRPVLIVLGLALALASPLAQILVAFLWSRGLIAPDPNGTLITSLQATSGFEMLLAPAGVALVGVGARLMRPRAWLALAVVAVPVLVILWIVGAAWLGGLAGEPF